MTDKSSKRKYTIGVDIDLDQTVVKLKSGERLTNELAEKLSEDAISKVTSPDEKEQPWLESKCMYNFRTGGKMTIKQANKSERLDLRLSAAQRAVLASAASLKQQSLTEFVLTSTLEAAENAILDQTLFMLDKRSFERFEKALNEPAKVNKKLLALLSEPSPWEWNTAPLNESRLI